MVMAPRLIDFAVTAVRMMAEKVASVRCNMACCKADVVAYVPLSSPVIEMPRTMLFEQLLPQLQLANSGETSPRDCVRRF